MNAVGFIKMSLEMSQNWIMALAMDMKDNPLQIPTPNGGNHPLWCLGHLAYSEANLLATATGEANPLSEWERLFGGGSQPQNDANAYPSFAELTEKFQEVRAATLAFLDTLGEDDLDQPSHAEGEMKEWFGTVGQCLAAIPMHFTYHGGQIADARRAAGRAPLMG